MNKLTSEKRAAVVAALVEGNSLRGTARLTGVARMTIEKLLRDLGTACAAYHDANVRNLKGEGHPLYPEDLRRYMAGSIRYVHQSLITSGWGWMDAEPEIEQLKPDIYLVNEDGDKPEKQAFCTQHGLEYVVLKRLPKPGLQRRSSTDLRGF